MPLRPFPILLLGWLLSGCGASLDPGLLAVAKQRSPDVTQESLTHGQSEFESKCSKCHKLPNPKSRSAEEWPKWIAKMQKRAKLDEASKKDVLDYVLAVRDSNP